MSTDWERIYEHAIEWAYEAGTIIRDSFRKQLTIETKSNADDLVTNMDREVENFLIDRVRKYYPDHQILGEEGSGDDVQSLEGTVWIIDPIDGTMNFVHQQTNFAISIAVYHEGIGKVGVIYSVVNDEMFHARAGNGAYLNKLELPRLEHVELDKSIIALNATWLTNNKRMNPSLLLPIVQSCRGTRSYGSAAIELAFVAAGRLDAYITMRLSPWDFAAGKILIEEVGGTITNLDGEPLNLLDRNSIFAGASDLHEHILEKYLTNGEG
ncbi:inositol monophosphatase family protein [Pseudalkalibacillus sp. SCS-8]|uniref:inositol monophosphatase family protein n=1 Tax=Pseudalkalibacillus nanhaiensis TaxID=3115291 RepID=UPI0032DA2607